MVHGRHLSTFVLTVHSFLIYYFLQALFTAPYTHWNAALASNHGKVYPQEILRKAFIKLQQQQLRYDGQGFGAGHEE